MIKGNHHLWLGLVLLITACDHSGDDHGHPHRAETDSASAAEQNHAHDDDSHVHEVPETEAFYGEEAASEPVRAETHAHEGEPHHTHSDGAEHVHDEHSADKSHTHQDDTAHGHDH